MGERERQGERENEGEGVKEGGRERTGEREKEEEREREKRKDRETESEPALRVKVVRKAHGQMWRTAVQPPSGPSGALKPPHVLPK